MLAVGHGPAVHQSPVCIELVEKILRRLRHVRAALLVEIHVQPGVSLWQTHHGVVASTRLHRLDDALVDTFDGRRLELEQGRYVAGGVHHVAVAETEEKRAGGRGHETNGGRDHDRAGAFGADQGAGHIKTVFGQQLTEVVAGHLAWDPVHLGSQDGHVRRRELAHRRTQLGCPGHRFGVGGVGCAQPVSECGEAQSIGRDQVQCLDVVGGAPVAHRVVAACVVADGPAEGCPGLARGVRCKGQFTVCLGRDLVLQGGEHHAGLRHRRPAVRIDGDESVHVPGEVQHHAGPDRVAAHARSATAGGERQVMPVAVGGHRSHLAIVPREDHREGLESVVRGVVGVFGETARRGVGAQPERL